MAQIRIGYGNEHYDKGRMGANAMDTALFRLDYDMFKLLIDHGADIEQCHWEKTTLEDGTERDNIGQIKSAIELQRFPKHGRGRMHAPANIQRIEQLYRQAKKAKQTAQASIEKAKQLLEQNQPSAFFASFFFNPANSKVQAKQELTKAYQTCSHEFFNLVKEVMANAKYDDSLLQKAILEMPESYRIKDPQTLLTLAIHHKTYTQTQRTVDSICQKLISQCPSSKWATHAKGLMTATKPHDDAIEEKAAGYADSLPVAACGA